MSNRQRTLFDGVVVAAMMIACCAFVFLSWGCSAIPPNATLDTPFVDLNTGEATPPPDPVQQRMTRSQVESIDMADLAARLADTENCILRRKSMGVDHCTCYGAYRTPPGAECTKAVSPSPRAGAGTRALPRRETPQPERDWKAWTKQAEGFEPRLKNGHIGYAHSCAENGDCDRWEGVTMTRDQGDVLFEIDWGKASDRAYTNLGRREDPIVSACYKWGCNGFKTLEDLLGALDSTGLERDMIPAEAIRELR